MRCDEIQMFHVVVFAYVYIYIYIYDTYSLLILKIAGGFPIWFGSWIFTETQLPQKNRGTLPQKRSPLKTMVGICLGGPQGSGPPNWLVATPWGQRKSQGKTNGDFRGKIPGPNVALERWRPYKRRNGFFEG